jgi:hypothetical protein
VLAGAERTRQRRPWFEGRIACGPDGRHPGRRWYSTRKVGEKGDAPVMATNAKQASYARDQLGGAAVREALVRAGREPLRVCCQFVRGALRSRSQAVSARCRNASTSSTAARAVKANKLASASDVAAATAAHCCTVG